MIQKGVKKSILKSPIRTYLKANDTKILHKVSNRVSNRVNRADKTNTSEPRLGFTEQATLITIHSNSVVPLNKIEQVNKLLT